MPDSEGHVSDSAYSNCPLQAWSVAQTVQSSWL